MTGARRMSSGALTGREAGGTGTRAPIAPAPIAPAPNISTSGKPPVAVTPAKRARGNSLSSVRSLLPSESDYQSAGETEGGRDFFDLDDLPSTSTTDDDLASTSNSETEGQNGRRHSKEKTHRGGVSVPKNDASSASAAPSNNNQPVPGPSQVGIKFPDNLTIDGLKTSNSGVSPQGSGVLPVDTSVRDPVKQNSAWIPAVNQTHLSSNRESFGPPSAKTR